MGVEICGTQYYYPECGVPTSVVSEGIYMLPFDLSLLTSIASFEC